MGEENTDQSQNTDQNTEQSQSPPASYVNADGTFSDQWAGALGDDFKDDAETLNRYKTIPDLAKGLMTHKRKLSADPDSLVQIPGVDATPEQIEAFDRKLGVPENTDDYKYEPAKELTEVLGDVDVEKMNQFKDFAHKELKLKPQQFEKLMDFYFKEQAQGIENHKTSFEAHKKQEFEEGTKALKKEFGDTLPETIDNINALTERYDAREFMVKHELENDPEWIGMWNRIMSDMSETRLKGLTPPSGQTPAEIDSKISELRNHPAYMDRSHREHKAIYAQVQELYKKRAG